jgi:hypothetical protein
VIGFHYRCVFKTVAICIMATMLTAVAADPTFESPSTGRFVLATSLGPELLKQCSRAAPHAVSGFWKPSMHDIDQLELALAKYLEDRARAGQQTPPQAQSYHRQYVGFTNGSERFIYGNFYPASAATGLWKDKEAKRAFGVCDGGPAFWGIVFRVSSKTVEEIRFNVSA